MLPKLIGRYQIKAELGRGGMSIVYWAHDPHFGRDVAIKLLAERLLTQEAFRVRFTREARTVAALDHPAIVPVYDFGEDDGRPYLVMRFMTGGSLADRLAANPLPLKEAVGLLQRLAPALDEAHELGIIHRDLKPSNILFDQRDDPFISDFGIVKLTAANTRLTETGGMVGTPAYMSPEQIQGNVALDGRSDVYSLGILIFEILTGAHPYDTDTPLGVAVKHIFEPVIRTLDNYPQLSPELRAIISRAMAKNREERYPTAAALAQVVAELAASTLAQGAPSAYPGTTDTHPPAIGRALILSVAHSEDPLLAKLAAPQFDMQELARILRHPDLGAFAEVTVIADGSTVAIRRGLSQFLADAGPADTCLIYVTGHAVFDTRGRLFLASRNTEVDLLRATAVPASFIAEELDNNPAASQVLVLDCTYSNAGSVSAPGLIVGKMVDTEASFAGEHDDRVIITAHNSIQYIWGQSGVIGQPPPSQFTPFLIEGLQSGAADLDGDGAITLHELFAYVSGRLQRASGAGPLQTPRKWPANSGDRILVGYNPHRLPTFTNTEQETLVSQNVPAAGNSYKVPDTFAASGQWLPSWFAWPHWALGVSAVLLMLLVWAAPGSWRSTAGGETNAADTAHLADKDLTSTAQAEAGESAMISRAAPLSEDGENPAVETLDSSAADAVTLPETISSQNLAVARQPSSVFARPDAESVELSFIKVGAAVEVLGRSQVGNWFYVYDGVASVGYAFAPRFDWEGDFDDLPIADAHDLTVPTACPEAGCPGLTIDLYPLPGARCEAGQVYRSVFIRGQGGDGLYTYFWEGQQLTDPLANLGFGFEVSNEAGATLIGTGRVTSGDGQMVELELFITDFDCGN